MKDGLNTGATTSITIQVTPDMFARFDDELIHPAYSTASMVKHMEQVSRQLILPYLETHEESAGAKVSMTHIAPTPEHTTVTLTATLSDITDKKVTCHVIAENTLGTIGKGDVTIAILPQGFMQNALQSVRENIH